MSTESPAPGIENLAAHADFVRSLARSLLLDEHRADDVAQETLLVALSRRPTGLRSPRAWLTTVARNLVYRSFRSDRRRSEREERAVPPGEVPDAADLVARLETTELLVRAVRELREPFRETVMLRFFEGQSPEEIARRKGIPSATVRGRLSRALAMLRERLDREHGPDGRSWSLALLPLALPSGKPAGGAVAAGGAAALLGGLVMSGKKIAVLVAVLLALAVGGAFLLSQSSAPAELERDESVLAGLPDLENGEESEPEAVPDADPVVTPPEARDWPIRVKTNLPGAEVTVTATYYGGEPDPKPIVKTADDAGFAGFILPDRRDLLYEASATATAPGYQPATAKIEDGAAVLELVPGRPLFGRVVDEDGHPVQGATVRVGGRHGSSDPDGRFVVYVLKGSRDKEGIERFWVYASHRSCLTARVVGVTLEDDPVMVLTRGRSVTGRILDVNGRPVPNLWVRAGQDRMQTREDGSFRLGALDERVHSVQVWVGNNRMGYPGGGVVDSIDITGQQDVTWNAGRIHIAKVLVRDEAGRPFRYASLIAKDRPSAGWGNPVMGDSGSDGQAAFSAGRARRVEVTALAPGWIPVTGVVEFDDDFVQKSITLVLRRPERPGRLGLTVRIGDGDIPARAFLTLRWKDLGIPGYFSREVELDGDGRALIEGIPPGEYSATVAGTKGWFDHVGYGMSATRKILIEPDREAICRVELPIGGRVRVTVTNRRGEVLIPPNDVLLVNEKGWLVAGTLGWHNPETGGMGSPPTPGPVETQAPVRPGRCFVEIERGNRVVGRKELEIIAGQTVEVTVPIDD